ncbi:MAG: hypothetical protein OXL98_06200 [Acidimicrobiaceae bacterium]|nr:hypothetical protein [Acidimicrobiaceae bacterium]
MYPHRAGGRHQDDDEDTDSDEPEPDTDSDEPEPATPARVAITGLGDVSDVSPIDADFGVVPGDANCYAWQGSGPLSAPVPIPDDDGTQRSVRLDTGSAVGEVQVTVRCFSDGYAAARKTAVFTVVSPVVCELRITLGGARVGNVWVSSCKSSQHGDQTPYYAKRYTLTLAEAATVTVVAVSDHAIDVYVHDGDAGSAKPLHTASSPGGEARAATVSALLNPEGMVGRYTVEVARRADRNPGGFTLSVSAVNVCPSDQTYMSAFARGSDDGCRPRVCASPLFRNPADQRCRTAAYRYGAAIIDGVMSAADEVIKDPGNAGRECVTRDSDPVTANELAAYVLAIPIRELHKDNPSLMDLSRWDSLFTNDESTGLFSKGTQTGEPRAHWSPGVGPWQLDLWEPVKEWHHAKRANVNHAAVEVAKHLFGGLCASEEKLKKQLETWLACKAQKRFGEDPDINHCIPIAETIYDDANDALRVRRVAGSDPDGGVQDRRCRWGTGGEPFDCHWYDIANAEGGATVYHPDGRTRKHCKDAGCGTFEIWYDITPLPLGFVSFTDTDGTKYAAFPANDIGEAGTGTGYAETLIRGVPKNKYAREVGAGVGDGYGWFVNAVGTRVLYIKHCPTQGTCSWHRV